MRHHGSHFADRGEPIAEPLAFLDLLDVREVLEEERRADGVVFVIADERQRVADHLVGGFEPQFGTVWQRLSFQRTRRGP